MAVVLSIRAVWLNAFLIAGCQTCKNSHRQDDNQRRLFHHIRFCGMQVCESHTCICIILSSS